MTQTAAQSFGSCLKEAERCVSTWEARWGPYEPHPSLRIDHESLSAAYETCINRLTGNFFSYSPCGADAQAPASGCDSGIYVTAMRINPNNHTLAGWPPTAAMEKEEVADLAMTIFFIAG